MDEPMLWLQLHGPGSVPRWLWDPGGDLGDAEHSASRTSKLIRCVCEVL